MTFKEKIYSLTRKIPKGNVVTYGQLARLAGKPKAARTVGYYMKINPNAPHTPCHRVVGSNGSLVGYSGKGGIAAKRRILLKEGVIFKGNRVDLMRSQWRKK